MAICATCGVDQKEGCAHLPKMESQAPALAVCATCGKREQTMFVKCGHLRNNLNLRNSDELLAIRAQIGIQPIPTRQNRAEAEKAFYGGE